MQPSKSVKNDGTLIGGLEEKNTPKTNELECLEKWGRFIKIVIWFVVILLLLIPQRESLGSVTFRWIQAILSVK